MAVERFLFGAHQRQPETLHSLLHSGEAVLKTRRPREAVVLHTAILETGRVRAAGAQFVAQEDIRDSGGVQRLLKVLAVELGVHAAVRYRSDVADRSDSVDAEQLEEAIHRVPGMSDGKDSVRHKAFLVTIVPALSCCNRV